jgi:predicted RNA-binding protein with EMAP domain
MLFREIELLGYRVDEIKRNKEKGHYLEVERKQRVKASAKSIIKELKELKNYAKESEFQELIEFIGELYEEN